MPDRVPVVSSEQVVEAATAVARPESDDAPLPNDIMGSFIKTRMAEIMGSDDAKELDVELDNILEWARSKGAESPEDIFWEIRELMHRLGAPGMGEDRVIWVNRYVFFDNQRRVAAEEMEKMEDGT